MKFVSKENADTLIGVSTGLMSAGVIVMCIGGTTATTLMCAATVPGVVALYVTRELRKLKK